MSADLQDLIVFEIEGQYQELRRGTLRVLQTINDRSTLSADLQSTDASYRPATRDELLVSEAIGSPATPLFGGAINKTVESGMDSVPDVPIVTRVNAVDFNALAEGRYVTETIPEGSTLKEALVILVDYLDVYGVTLDPSQVDGPTLPELVFDNKRLDACFSDLVTLTEYIREIDALKVLRMYAVGSVSAAFDVTEGETDIVGDLTVESGEDDYADRVVLLAGNGTKWVIAEHHDGDGVSRRFYPDTKIVESGGILQGPIGVRIYDPDYPTDPAGYHGFLVGVYGQDDWPWTYDADDGPTGAFVQRADQQIVSDAAGSPGGAYLEFDYCGAFPMTVYAQTSPWTREIVLRDPEIFSRVAAQAIVDAELARRVATQDARIVKYATYRPGLRVGQVQTIHAPSRNVSNTECLIVELKITDTLAETLRYEVTALDGASKGTWQAFWRRFRAAAGGGVGGVSQSTVITGTSLSTVAPINGTGAVPGTLVIRKRDDESVTSSTLLQKDDELIFPIGANEVWVVTFHLYVQGGAGDLQAAVSAPPGASGNLGGLRLQLSPTGTEGDVATSAGVADLATGRGHGTVGGSTTYGQFTALIVNGATAGQVALKWAQDSSTGTATIVKANSFLVAHRVLGSPVGFNVIDLELEALVFSGFGSAPMAFVDASGAQLPPPAGDPKIGPPASGAASSSDPDDPDYDGQSGCQGLVQLDGGAYAFTGTATGTADGFLSSGTFPVDLSVYQGDVTQFLRSIHTGYDNGYFYGLYPAPSGNYKIYKIDSDGAKQGELDLGASYSPSPVAIGVTSDESLAYFAVALADTVNKRDFGAPSTTAFATESGKKVAANAILVLRNGKVLVGWNGGGAGYVKYYDTDGTVLDTFDLGSDTPIVLTPGLDDTAFYCSAYSSGATNSSGVLVHKITISTGDIVSIDPADITLSSPYSGTFQFDGPFCVIRKLQ